MKEFDIYLNKRLTECDILVYSIPYRDGLTVINRLILESCIKSYTLTKFIAMQTGSELVSHIDTMLKTCYERLNFTAKMCSSAEFNVFYAISPRTAGIDLSAGEVKMLAESFIATESALEMATEPLLAFIGKSGGKAESSLTLKAEIEDSLKRCIEKVSPPITIESSVVGTHKQSVLSVDDGVPLVSELTNLCYRINNIVESAVNITASVVGTEMHYSLGRGNSAVIADASVTDGDCAYKHFAITNVVSALASVVESLTQFMEPPENQQILGIEVNYTIKRHRTLGEMDDNTLSDYDDMILEEVDYVIL